MIFKKIYFLDKKYTKKASNYILALLVTSTGQSSNFLNEDINLIISLKMRHILQQTKFLGLKFKETNKVFN